MNFFEECLQKAVQAAWPQRKPKFTEAEMREIVKRERERKEILHAERNAQLEADPEYKAWLDSL